MLLHYTISDWSGTLFSPSPLNGLPPVSLGTLPALSCGIHAGELDTSAGVRRTSNTLPTAPALGNTLNCRGKQDCFSLYLILELNTKLILTPFLPSSWTLPLQIGVRADQDHFVDRPQICRTTCLYPNLPNEFILTREYLSYPSYPPLPPGQIWVN